MKDANVQITCWYLVFKLEVVHRPRAQMEMVDYLYHHKACHLMAYCFTIGLLKYIINNSDLI